MSNIAIILAGGVGSRVGSSIPKQFIKIQGKPVISYTIEAFQKKSNIDAIEVVCHKDYMDYLQEIITDYHFDKVKWVTLGGHDFQGSVINGLNNLNGKILDDDIVLIHYGASPLVSDDIIDDAINVCMKRGNATPATTCYLLAGTHDGEKSTKWLDRDHIALLNSPHTFKYGYVKNIYERAEKVGILEKTEPHTTSLMYELGDPIYLSKGSTSNIKITTKEDLDLFEGYILLKKYRESEKLK